MIYLSDHEGGQIRLSDQRRSHILEHPEMVGLDAEIGMTVRDPEIVLRSRTDESVRLYYRSCQTTIVGRKWLCVVVKYTSGKDAFVLTAYLTNRPKTGEVLWPKP